jgi:MFS family permease
MEAPIMLATNRILSTPPSSKTLLLSGLTTGHMVNDFYSMVLPPLIPALIPVFGLNYFQIGLLSFCFYILSGVLQPTIGFWSDKHAIRKKVIIAGFLINGLGLLAIGLAPTYPLVLFASLLCGRRRFTPSPPTFSAGRFRTPKAASWASTAGAAPSAISWPRSPWRR